MPDYTKKNISELKDSAPEFGMDEIQEARFPAKELDAEDTGFGHHRRQARASAKASGISHDEAEEVYFVVPGSGRVKLDDEIVELEQGDFLRVSPPVKRRFEADDDGLEMRRLRHASRGRRRHGSGVLGARRERLIRRARLRRSDRATRPAATAPSGMRHAAAMAAKANAAE